jgi:hypothetical protein
VRLNAFFSDFFRKSESSLSVAKFEGLAGQLVQIGADYVIAADVQWIAA